MNDSTELTNLMTFLHSLLIQAEVIDDLKPPAEVGLNGYLLFYTVVMLAVVMAFVWYMARQHNVIAQSATEAVKQAQETVRQVSDNWRKDNEEKDKRLDALETAVQNHDHATSTAVRIIESLPKYIKDELTSTQNTLVKEILESRTAADQKLTAVESAIVGAVAEKVKEHIQPLREEIVANYNRLIADAVKPPELPAA